jgi:enoyl-CoA hydratase/carnithine racemase
MSGKAARGVKATREGHVLKLELDAPPANTLDVPLMRSLASLVTAAAAEPWGTRPRALVLGSAVAGQFSQGVDLETVVGATLDGRRAIFLALADMVEAFWCSYVPLVVDVSGPALAGGAVLASLGDFTLIDAKAGKICWSEPKVGLPLPGFAQALASRKLPPGARAEVLLLGKNVDAAEAVRLGLATSSYTGATERAEALGQLLAKVTRLSPEALSQSLREDRALDGGRAALARFRSDMVAFSDFLSDAAVARGLGAVARGETPKF